MLRNYELLNKVSKCPKCGKGIKPVDVSYIENEEDLIVVQRCPICEELIILHYNNVYSDYLTYELLRVYPYDNSTQEFSDEIKNISNNFVKIYNQSKTAENLGLTDICGVGYRKSLEHLVKDYAKIKNPDDIEAIEKRPLKQCIEAYIDHPKIKRCILGATYLGNDETHYIRKIENKDINDLKTLIKLATLWIEMDEATLRYENDPELNLS